MNTIGKTFFLLGLLVATSGCSTWRKLDNSEKGAVIGGGTGVVVGNAIAPGVGGTIIGGAAGAVGGAVIGDSQEERDKKRRY
jgi:outer membrane lipoprotein SlyB